MNSILLFAILLTVPAQPAADQAATEREVSFQTEDGWTISGMFNAPKNDTHKTPAVLFLHAFAHDREAYGQYLYPGLAQIIGGRSVSTLRIDLRGRGSSIGKKELHSFSSDELSKIYLDVRGAIKFLAGQESVDPARIAIVAEEESADAAILGSAGDPRVKAIVLISGRLSESAKRTIGAQRSAALLLIVSKEDRIGFQDMAAAYNLTRNPSSRIWVFADIGIATTMFSVWRSEYPKREPIEEGITRWVLDQIGDRPFRSISSRVQSRPLRNP